MTEWKKDGEKKHCTINLTQSCILMSKRNAKRQKAKTAYLILSIKGLCLGSPSSITEKRSEQKKHCEIALPREVHLHRKETLLRQNQRILSNISISQSSLVMFSQFYEWIKEGEKSLQNIPTQICIFMSKWNATKARWSYLILII